MPFIPDHVRLEALAKVEQAIGTSELAITRQLLLIETQEHLAELHAKRRQLLDASTA